MDVNSLTYGNINRDYLPYLQPSYLDSLITELKNYPFPDNDSDIAREELVKLVSVTDQMDMPDNEIMKKRFLLYDTDFDSHIVKVLSENGVDKKEVSEIINSIQEDIMPLIIKLKYYYQRIRPIQLSHLKNIPLFPFRSYTDNTPSYPSAYSVKVKVYAEVLGNKYPKFYKKLIELSDDVIWSRIYMGVNYMSDCDFGVHVAGIICHHPDFKKKYKL